MNRILVVDDNAALLDNLREVLEDAGYSFAGAGTAAEALRAASTGFDVAVVDLRLPDESGHVLARKLKELWPEGEVVLLTGFATLETAIEAVRSGAFAYLVKPCATSDLLLTIEQALRQARLHAEKRELSRRAHVAEKLAAVGTLTAGLSHEIRNPLNGAVLQLSVLERRVRRLPPDLEPEALLEPLGLVRDEIKRLERLLEDFLRFARPRELRLERVDLTALADSAVTMLAADAAQRGLQFAPSLQRVAVLGDAERLRQVLFNLVLNALDATPSGGRVAVALAAEAREAVLTVDDSGPGIPDAARARIFEPFFTTKPAGTGLGLPIVQSIVTQHAGTIAAERGPLGGARFTVRLPLAP